MDEDVLQQGMTVVLEALQVTPAQADEIERATRMQANCPHWVAQRKNRLTSSNCGDVANLQDSTPRSNTVKKITNPRDLR